MVPKESNCINRLMMEFFFSATSLPPQALHRMPIMVRFIMILSRSNNAISGVKMQWLQRCANKRDECEEGRDEGGEGWDFLK